MVASSEVKTDSIGGKVSGIGDNINRCNQYAVFSRDNYSRAA
jgi:hypothetical protein